MEACSEASSSEQSSLSRAHGAIIGTASDDASSRSSLHEQTVPLRERLDGQAVSQDAEVPVRQSEPPGRRPRSEACAIQADPLLECAATQIFEISAKVDRREALANNEKRQESSGRVHARSAPPSL